jgi:hypothetical protein
VGEEIGIGTYMEWVNMTPDKTPPGKTNLEYVYKWGKQKKGYSKHNL